LAQSLKHIGVVALAASAWIAASEGAQAQVFGTDVVNVASVSYDSGAGTESIATNRAVFTIRPAASPAVIEFFRHSTVAPSPIMRSINGSDFSPSGDLAGPFTTVGAPVTTGGDIIDLSGEIPLTPATTYLAGELMFVRVIDTGQNLDSNAIDTLNITITADTGDVIVLRLYESDPDSGEFWAYVPSTLNTAIQNDKELSVGSNTQLTAQYIDVFDATDVTVDTALINPLNRVFSSVSGELVDGAVITLIDLDTNTEATVWGVDGFSVFPSEVTSGEEVQDTGGLTYEIGTGEFRYPIVETGNYAIRVEPPEGYRFSSVLPPDSFTQFSDGSFVITGASFGRDFNLGEQGPLRFDIPLDPDTDLVLNKTADRSFGDVGDFVNYTVTIENRGVSAAPIMLHDTLPVGFRYVQGTSRVAQETIDEPQVSENATLLTFPMGLIQPGETISLDYALEIGPGAPMGDAVNEAVIRDSVGEQLSNIARAGIRLREDLLRSRSTIVGRISEKSCDGNEEWARNIERGTGVEGVRLYMETGAYVVSDPDGLFHFEGVREGTHVVQVDEETLPQGFELMKCEENTRYAGAVNSKFVDVQGGGIWRANFYLKQTGQREDYVEEVEFNDAKEYKNYDVTWLENQNADIDWVYPDTNRTPSKPSTNIGIKHGADHVIQLAVNGKTVSDMNFVGKDGNSDRSVMISRWRGVDLLEGRNEIIATVKDRSGAIVKTLREEISFVKNIARAIAMPDQSTLVADGRSVPVVAIRMEDEAGRPVHAGRITTIDVEPPYRLYDETGENRLIEQTHDLIAPLSARQDFSIGSDGILKVKLEPTLRTGKVTVIATLDNGRKVPIYMYMEPEKRDWILVGLAEGSVGYEDISGNAIALGETEGKDVIKDGRLAFFAKGMIKGNWLMTLSADTSKHKRTGNIDGDFLGEIDPNAYYTLYGDRSYQEFEGVSRYPVFVKLEKRQAYAMFGDYDTNITEGRLTSYNRRLSGLKAEYLGDNLQVLGFAAETNQGFAKDEIAADGTSGTYQLSNQRILAQSEEIVVETRDRFRPDIVLERKVMVRFLDYTLDYYTGQLIFRLPVDVSDAEFNPNVIVVDYETAEDAERNITFGGRVQTQIIDDKVQIGSTFVHEDGSNLQGGIEQNQIGIDVIAQVTDNTQVRAELAVTENNGSANDGVSKAILAEVIHTSENFTGEAYFREEEAGYGVGQTNSNTNGVRRYGVTGAYKFDEFEDEETGRRGNRRIEAQAFREENLTSGNSRNTAEVVATHQGELITISGGLRASKDELVGLEDRESLLAIGRASVRVPKFDATIQLSHEQPLGGKDEVSAYPQRTTIGVDKNLKDKATLSVRHELLNGADTKSNNTVVGISTTPWKGTTISANSDLLTNDSGRRLGATVGLDQQVQINENWSASGGLRNRNVLEQKGTFIEVAPDAAISPLETNEDFTSAYIGAAYRDDVMSGSARLEGRKSTIGDTITATAGVARELSEELSLAGSARALFNNPDNQAQNTSQLDVRLGGAWRPRNEDTIIFDRFDISHDKNARGETETKVVNNIAINQMITDRLQATANYGVKYVRTEIGGQKLKGWNHLLGGEARFDVTERVDIGLRGSYLTSTGTNSAQYSFGPSIGVSPAKNIWVSAGYNIKGFKDDDFEAAEYSRKGVYLQMRLKFDQNTARGLLRRISPANAQPYTPKQVYTVKKEQAPTTVAPVVQQSYLCSDEQTQVFDLAACPVMSAPAPVVQPAPVVEPQPQTVLCPDGVTTVYDVNVCPVEVAKPILMPEPAPVLRPNLNQCGSSNVAIFSVPSDKAPKQINRLGTMPQFGDSHDLSSVEFFEKLQARYNSSEKDRTYLDYLFNSMGYANGFADAESYMFSDDLLPVGTRGLLGFGEDHHYEYSVLPSAVQDREAFRVMSLNGSVVHFMKACGNYFYGCE